MYDKSIHRTVERACIQCGALSPVLADLAWRAACGQYCSDRCKVDGIWAKGRRSESGCLEWSGGKTVQGYGRISVNGKTVRVPRLAWTLTNGPIPDGLWVLHHCDNPPCFEPAHLFLGDAKANGADMSQKGRSSAQAHPERVPRGTANGIAVLTDAIVRDIRRRRVAGESLRAIAAVYSVTHRTVSLVANRKTWAHVK